ncbi:MAG: L-aspartate oxidase [Candidatus Krumholzibacteria bacterium]|jgi:L-aspartate oxidase|nr:L-aspartate oxidase [Candidatus Krumholzibacteria bacterium]MDP6668866.1 L-aspartate oxidase [Candidatus Krumholzibacteria bacterium]
MKIDFLVIGSGVAGLSFALKASRMGKVLLVTKSEAPESNTRRAQGGIAAVTSRDDSPESHEEDTLRAGAGLCDRSRVRHMVESGPERIRELLDWGVPFSKEGEELALGQEGGHSFRRVLHVADFTGRELERVLLERVAAEPSIQLLEDHMAVNLATHRHLKKGGEEGRVYGAYLMDRKKRSILSVAARWTILATGGAGKVYAYTSNPDVATGDGVAMAYRAGARIANMEFVQFHPTCLYHRKVRTQLISEAVRGEGAILRNLDGEAFMERYTMQRELAPRDIVARAIDQEMKRRGDKFALLDFSPIGKERIPERFPSIYAALQRLGMDPRERSIPVVPAAHYFCGGVEVDGQGQSSLPRLLAIGEVSCTGVHGANRLASNSLLEALVFAHEASEALSANFDPSGEIPEVEPWSSANTRDYREAVVLDHDWDLVRRMMMDYVGIVRSDERLLLARDRLRHVRETVEKFYWRYSICSEIIELRNIALLAELIIRSALLRKESRGLHCNLDHPETRSDLASPTCLEQEILHA